MAESISETERLAIEQACRRQVFHFARLNDARDHEGLARLFTSDGGFARPTDPDNPVRGREAIEAFFRDRPVRKTRHLMSNLVVDVLSRDEARAHCYVLLFTGEPDAGVSAVDAVLVGDFNDLFVLEDGDWLFKERRGTLALKS